MNLTETSVHLVLARVYPTRRAGLQAGISLFLVTQVSGQCRRKFLGKRNPFSCGSIEHKMGNQRLLDLVVMNFDGAQGLSDLVK